MRLAYARLEKPWEQRSRAWGYSSRSHPGRSISDHAASRFLSFLGSVLDNPELSYVAYVEQLHLLMGYFYFCQVVVKSSSRRLSLGDFPVPLSSSGPRPLADANG